jgi:hypothetical protein
MNKNVRINNIPERPKEVIHDVVQNYLQQRNVELE